MPYMMDPTYNPTPRGRGLFPTPPQTDPMQPMQDPTYVPQPKVGVTPFIDPNDPRNDPRNIRARRARENPLLTPPPPPPPTMGYGPAGGDPTASLSPGVSSIPRSPTPWSKAPMLPGHGIMYPKPLVSIPQWGGGGPSVGFRTPAGLSPQRPKLF